MSTQELRWIKASASINTGACVEMAVDPEGAVLVRNSRDPEMIQEYTHSEFEAFLGGAKDGEFDQLLEEARRSVRR